MKPLPHCGDDQQRHRYLHIKWIPGKAAQLVADRYVDGTVCTRLVVDDCNREQPGINHHECASEAQQRKKQHQPEPIGAEEECNRTEIQTGCPIGSRSEQAVEIGPDANQTSERRQRYPAFESRRLSTPERPGESGGRSSGQWIKSWRAPVKPKQQPRNVHYEINQAHENHECQISNDE